METGCTVDVAGQPVDVWPAAAKIERWIEPAIKMVQFPDTDRYHPGLIARVLELENDQTLAKSFGGYTGSSKVYHLDRWACPEAALIQARAQALFKRVVGAKTAAVDLSWGNIYRRGDYCMPHSHIRAMASVVYFLDLGTEATEGHGHGRFCFADPRLQVCCQNEADAMTSPCGPIVRNGTMIIFPGKVVHFVDVYNDPGTRITLSWNINPSEIPGDPLHYPKRWTKPSHPTQPSTRPR